MRRAPAKEGEGEDSDCSGSDAEESSWVQWFCSLKGNEFFAEVDHDFMQDDFNLTGLSAQVPYYEYALDTILDAESSATARFSKEQQESIESAAELLYGLIHARYIITPRGMAAMLEKYKHCHFGRCPRVHCQGQPALPVGQSDLPRMHTTKIFCGRCQDIYYPRSSRQANVDGAYFGTSFCHLFMQSYWELVPTPPAASYVPRIFGFKIHKSARAAAIAAAQGAAAAAAPASAVDVDAGTNTKGPPLPMPPLRQHTSGSAVEAGLDSPRAGGTSKALLTGSSQKGGSQPK
mmetsp:Transcript_22055/g.56291  ORF Transcript_22055/g.56291 Transcript_22055/m.56291 type:complete len:291 (-) Transcript_22055:249-1121(-)